ncbi:MAG: DNA/RNA non-specific endonuclease [Phocaeicola sp.]|nr:DNA/RNA non-specific endonuclease [Phocaeicola sp.]
MKRINLLSSVLLTLLFTACQEKETLQPTPQKIYFSGIIDGEGSRAYNSSWSEGDAIGVFMLSSADKKTLEVNKQYTTTGNGHFSPVGDALSFPIDGSKVDFIAYYPYKAGVSLETYPIETAIQTNLESIDLLRSDNLQGRSNINISNNLQFRHVLSKVVLNLSSDGDLTGLTATVKGVKTKGSLRLMDGKLTVNATVADVPMHISADGRTAEAILLPQTLNTPLVIELAWKGKIVSIATKLTALEAAIKHTYNIKVEGTGKIEAEATGYFRRMETPVITADFLKKSNVHYITHMENGKTESATNPRNFSLLYDSDLKIAYWVAYPYNSYYDGNVGRTEAWGNFDPALSSNFQSSVKKGYTSSGYDRGHQIPSGDRQNSRTMNQATFYPTNMTPQLHNFNTQIWKNLEEKVRKWASGTDTLYIVTGAVPSTKENPEIKWYTNSNDNKKIAVPQAYYKVLARKIGGTYRTIGFYLEHRDGYNSKGYMQYAVSVSDVEKKTGFTFFPQIDRNIKATLNKEEWQ